MARKCKCVICKKDLTTDIAYKIDKKYYCSEEEYNSLNQDKVTHKLIIDNLNYILGYTCLNTIIFKEIKTLKINYTYAQINNYLELEKEKIKLIISKKNIDSEFGKIRYIFTIIKNSIEDFQNIKIKLPISNSIPNIEDINTKATWTSKQSTNFLDMI